MLEWLLTHDEIILALIGLFGAGGAGALIIQHLTQRGKDDAEHKGNVTTINTTASGDAIALTNTGPGAVSITKNVTISHEALEAWRSRLGLSLTAASRLFEACARADLRPESVTQLGNAFDSSSTIRLSPNWSALREALEANDLDRASVLLRTLASAI